MMIDDISCAMCKLNDIKVIICGFEINQCILWFVACRALAVEEMGAAAISHHHSAPSGAAVVVGSGSAPGTSASAGAGAAGTSGIIAIAPAAAAAAVPGQVAALEALRDDALRHGSANVREAVLQDIQVRACVSACVCAVPCASLVQLSCVVF